MADLPAAFLDNFIELLNEILQTDSVAINALFAHRVPVNQAMVEHPTVQVGGEDGKPDMSVLGLLNGLIGKDADGWGYLAAKYEGDRIVEFLRTPQVGRGPGKV